MTHVEFDSNSGKKLKNEEKWLTTPIFKTEQKSSNNCESEINKNNRVPVKSEKGKNVDNGNNIIDFKKFYATHRRTRGNEMKKILNGNMNVSQQEGRGIPKHIQEPVTEEVVKLI